MTTTFADPRIKQLPQWAQQHIARLEATVRALKERDTPRPDRAELWLSGERLHIRNLSPDEIDVNFAGTFLVVWPQASNQIILTGGIPNSKNTLPNLPMP